MFNVSTMRTNDQQQSFRPLVNSTVDYFLVDRVPETVQNLFQMVDVFELLDTPAAEEHTNWIIHRLRWDDLDGQFDGSIKSRTFCLLDG